MTALLTRDEFLRQTISGDAFAGIQNEWIDEALVWASSVASSYLRKRFTFPLVSWGDDVKTNVAALAQFSLLRRRGFRPGSGNDDIARLTYEDAIRWLERVASGAVEPEIIDSTADVDEGGALAASDTNTVSWNMTTRARTSGGCCDE